jgi:cellulose synthase/poly-beta-1,6-N-acetylglucosamine synthase-like glycosyltransferase
MEMANQLAPKGTIEYVPEASCTTNVPETSSQFVSQRYRWTSSTYCCLIKSPLAAMGLGVGTAWLVDTFNSLFFLSFTLHFYYVMFFNFFPALLTDWSSLQSALSVEVLVLVLNMILPIIIAWITHRENALGYAWAYIVRQYVFAYSIWVPLGTLWTLHNVKVRLFCVDGSCHTAHPLTISLSTPVLI